MKSLSPLLVGCAAFLLTAVAAFLLLDRALATDHDLYGTAAESKMMAAGLAGLVGGVIAATLVRRLSRQKATAVA